jgi:O-antigen/teichoic acid export membrane protein
LHDRFGLAALADAVRPVTRMIGAIVVIVKGASIIGFLSAWAAAELATALVYWSLAFYAAGPEARTVFRMRVDNVRGENPSLLRFASLTNAGSILTAASNQTLVIIVGLFVGTSAAGGFRLARQLGLALAKFTRTLSRASFPELVRANSAASGTDFWRLFKMTSALAVMGALIIIVLLFLFGRQAIILIAGPDFAFATPLLLLLGSAAAIDLAGVGFEPALIARGRAGRVAALRLISTLLLLFLMFFLLPKFGAIGGAAAVLVAAVFNLFLFTASSWRLIGTNSDQADTA